MAQNGESGERPQSDETTAPRGNGEAAEPGFGMRQAADAVERLRAVIDQASRAMRELSTASEEWAEAQARDIVANVRTQGGRAVGTVSRQVGENPLTSLAIAFAVGYVCGILTRR
jgi:ElaB/YqjD/DUF883 family membrane-anchored ribosome-binding protein